jgi:hypothetical protein
MNKQAILLIPATNDSATQVRGIFNQETGEFCNLVGMLVATCKEVQGWGINVWIDPEGNDLGDCEILSPVLN